MKPLTTEETLAQIDSQKTITLPTLQELRNPDYHIYANAPYWRVHQAVCLLTGIAILDRETFDTMVHLPEINLMINKALTQKGIIQVEKVKYNDFVNLVTYYFPVPHDTIHYIRNVYKKLTLALENGSLKFTEISIRGIKEKGLDPLSTIEFALTNGIDIPEDLTLLMLNRKNIKLLKLPEIFPDKISFYGLWVKLKIEDNKKKTGYIPVSNPINVPFCPPPFENEYDDGKTLSEQELNFPLNLLLNVYLLSPRGERLNAKGREQLSTELKKRAPCTLKHFRMTIYTDIQFAYLYYGISPDLCDEYNPSLTNPLFYSHMLIDIIDKEEGILKAFKNYLKSKKLPHQNELSCFIAFLKEKAIKVPEHLLPSSEATMTPKEPDTSENFEELCPFGKAQFEKACSLGTHVLSLAIQHTYNDKVERIQHKHIISTYCSPKRSEFKKKFTKKRTPKHFEYEHKCRALARYLHSTNSRISINEIYEHPLMKSLCGSFLSKFKKRTFSGWLHKDEIRDRAKLS